jgi:Tfp pilus assembly protein PilN
LFIAAFLITLKVLQQSKEIEELDSEITQKTIIARQNQEMLSKIAELETRISTFDQTVAILDSAAAGSGVFKSVLKEFSDFGARKQGIWLSKLSKEDARTANIEGYSLSRYTLTDFAYSIQQATLNSMLNESLRDKNAYKFNITFDISSYPKKSNE